MTKQSDLFIPNYEKTFEEIIRIDEETRLTDLMAAEPSTESPSSLYNFSALWILSFLFKGPSEISPNSLEGRKLLAKTFKRWNRLLDEQLENARYDPKKLYELHKIIRQTFFAHGDVSKNKIMIIKNLLQQHQVKDKRIDQALNRMRELISRILRAPRLEHGSSLPQAKPAVYTHAELIERQARNIKTRKIHSAPDLRVCNRKEATIREITREQESGLRKVFHSRMASIQERELTWGHLAFFGPQKDKDWENKLEQAFKELRRSDDVKNASRILEPIQVICILTFVLDNKDHNWKLPFVIGSLKCETLAQVIVAFNDEEISRLNRALLECDESSRMWFDRVFVDLRQKFINLSNRKKEEIDMITRKFRTELKRHEITAADINDAKTRLGEILLHWETVSKLRLLLVNVTQDPQTVSDLIDLNNEYEILASRLDDGCGRKQAPLMEHTRPEMEKLVQETNRHKEKVSQLKVKLQEICSGQEWNQITPLLFDLEQDCDMHIAHLRKESFHPRAPGGRVFDIIDNMAFEAFRREDDEEAFECLGDWGIYFPEDYKDVGLLGKISEHEFRELRQNSATLYKLGRDNLTRLGIKTVLDWKRLQIYNRNLLRDYLLRPDIAKQIMTI